MALQRPVLLSAHHERLIAMTTGYELIEAQA